MKKFRNDKYPRLRSLAEKAIQGKPIDTSDLSREDLSHLVHELQVHQTELALQNEALQTAQHELDAARQKYADLYEFAPVGFVAIDVEGEIIETNFTFSTMIGALKDEIYYKRYLSRFVVDEDKGLYFSFYRQLTRSIVTRHVELRLRRIDGEIVHVRLHATPEDAPESGAGYYRIAVMDVSDYRTAKRQVDRVERNYRFLAESVNDVFFALDGSLRVSYWNAASEALTGLSAEQTVGAAGLEVFESIGELPFYQKLIETINEGEESNFSHERRVGSEKRYLHVSAYPAHGGVVALARDVTEKRRAEREIQEQREYLQELTDNLPAYIAHIARDERFIFANKQYAAYYDVSLDDIVGRKLLDVVGEETYAVAKPNFDKALKGEKVVYEVDAPCPGGDVCVFRIEYIPRRDERGEIDSVYSLVLDDTPRRRAERALEREHRFVERVVAALPSFIYIHDIQKARNVYANNMLSVILGYAPDELAKMGDEVMARLIHPDDLPAVADVVGEMSRDREDRVYVSEYRMRHKNGEWIWCNNSAVVFERNEAGVPTKIVGGVFDISDRKRAELERAKLAAIVESSNDAIIGKTLDGVVESWNAGAERIYGYAAEEMIGKSIEELHPPEARGEMEEILERIKRGEAIVRRRAERVDREGRRLEVELSISPITDDRGEPVGASTIAADVTERARAEERLKESERRFRTLLENVNLYAIMLDLESGITFVNGYLLKKLGYEREDLIGEKVWKLYEGREEWERVRAETDARIRAGEELPSLDIPMVTKSGEVRLTQWTRTPIHDVDGNVVGRAGVGVDVTERRRIEAEKDRHRRELEELNRDKDTFYSIIAHDVKNPFQSLFGLARVLRDGANALSREKIAIYAEHLYRSTGGVFELLENLLEWTRLQSGRISPKPAAFAVRDVVKRAASQTTGQTASAGVTIEYKIPDTIEAYADERMVETILRNLLSNAVKFSEKGNAVLVKARRRGDRATIEVIDEGLGMTSEDAARLFDVDWRGEIDAPKERKGSGLGLKLCREFVHANAGEIRAKSAPGEGSVFTVVLPASAPDAS